MFGTFIHVISLTNRLTMENQSSFYSSMKEVLARLENEIDNDDANCRENILALHFSLAQQALQGCSHKQTAITQHALKVHRQIATAATRNVSFALGLDYVAGMLKFVFRLNFRKMQDQFSSCSLEDCRRHESMGNGYEKRRVARIEPHSTRLLIGRSSHFVGICHRHGESEDIVNVDDMFHTHDSI